MTIRSGFFNAIEDDRVYDAAFFAEYFATFIGNGIFVNPSTSLQVYSNENLTTKVSIGKGWINGYFIINDSDYILTHDRADGALKRIDRVVMQLDHKKRTIEIVIKKGAFASTPIAPTLVRNGDLYELALADVSINNGATQITQAHITDQRLNKALCGIVHGLVEQVDTTTIFNQYQAWLEEYKGINAAEWEAWQNQEKADFEAWRMDEEQAFNDWFDNVKAVLEGDVASNLLTLINDHKADTIVHVQPGERETWNAKATVAQVNNAIAQIELGIERDFYTIKRSDKDAFGTFKVVEHFRENGKRVRRSSLFGTAPTYANRSVTYYASNGTTIITTINSKLTYDADDDLINEVVT
ncbi:hypothetical protein [Bacillus sp. Hm123]|uniref:hypothetical protein n=1 Tax=Bacillus sp. Hm123 TaxID=3450745 RepID=UPI003F44263E